jgi:hypothetical protein
VGRYLVLLVAPLKLSLDYGSHVIGWTVNWREPCIYIGIATTLTWLIAAIASLRRKNLAILFCLLALAISYGMVSNSIVLIGTIFGERLMYLPSVFFLILVAALLDHLFTGFKPAFFPVVVILLGLPLSIRAFTYARLWNDPLKLYLYDLRAYPESMHLHGLATHEYIDRGDYSAARRIAEDCRRELPDVWQSYQMCVAVDLKLNDFADAERVLANADPRCPGLAIERLRSTVQAARKEFDRSRGQLSRANGNLTTVSRLLGNTP